MTWVWLAIAAHLFWAFSNIGSKYVVSNKIKNPYVLAVAEGILGLLAVAVAVIPFIDFIVPPLELIGWLTLAGALYFFGGFPYVKALQIEDVTRINIWWSFIPLFSFFIAWFTIHEKLNNFEFLALILLVSGAIMASIHKQIRGWRFSRAIWLMIISTLAFAFYAVIIRFASETMNFASIFVWVYVLVGIFACLTLLFRPLRTVCMEEFKTADRNLATAVAGIAIMDYLGLWFNVWALSLGPVALVYAMEGFQALFVFLITIAVSFFTNINLKEELDSGNIILKVTALVLMITGVAMINLA